MLAPVLAPFLARHGIHYGWAMVAVTFLTALSMAAAMGVPGVLILPLEHEYGWSAGSISGPLALRLLLFGGMAPFAAAVMQRYGLKITVAIALALVLAAFGMASRMHALWELWVSWGLFAGIGTGMTAMVLGATVASRWFTAKRGLVLGILTASTATGQLALLPVAQYLSDHYGWRAAVVPASIACVVSALLMLLVGVDHPAQVGLAAYGETRVQPPPPRQGGAVGNALRALADAAGTRTFWLLFLTFFVCGLSTNGLVQTHFIPLCFDFGMPSVQAASLLAVMGGFDFVGTIGSGWLSDRIDSRKLLFWYYGLRGLSLMFLPFSGFTVIGLSLFAVFYGLDWIATVPPTVRLAAQHFGRERAPLVFGWVFTAHQLGAAVAAYGGGYSRDALGSYLPAYFAAGAACMLAALAAIAIGRRGPALVAPVAAAAR